MTVLAKTVHRETNGTVFDSGENRHVIVSVDPLSGLVSFRLKGTRRVYGLPARYLYMHAAAKHVALDKTRRAKTRKRTRTIRRGVLPV